MAELTRRMWLILTTFDGGYAYIITFLCLLYSNRVNSCDILARAIIWPQKSQIIYRRVLFESSLNVDFLEQAFCIVTITCEISIIQGCYNSLEFTNFSKSRKIFLVTKRQQKDEKVYVTKFRFMWHLCLMRLNCMLVT